MKTAAWTAPAIVLVTAAPLAAASPNGTITPGGLLGQCYQSGNQFGFSFTLTSTVNLTITDINSCSPGYGILRNHANLFYFKGGNTVNGKLPANTNWQLSANNTANVSVMLAYAGPGKWPGYPTAPGGHGTEPFTIAFDAHDDNGNPVCIKLTFAAGYDLPNPGGSQGTQGSCQAPPKAGNFLGSNSITVMTSSGSCGCSVPDGN